MDPVTQALMNEFATENNINQYSDAKKFEHFCAFSIVSSHHSDDFETDELVSGAGADLGVDAFAVKVNGRLAYDVDHITDLLEINKYLDVEFIIVQAKTASKFEGALIGALGDNLANQVFSKKQTMPVNQDVARLIKIQTTIFENASKLRNNPSLRVYYACTGNWSEDPYILSIITQKTKDLIDKNLFSDVVIQPLGAREIQEMYRNTRTSISREVTFDKLVTLPAIDNVRASYLGVLPVTEYLKLISDADGGILRSVFVDNVRDFQGENPVNEDIAKTILDGLFDQFVLRNNGITIVARDVRVTSSQYILEDYQIVNGCQTSHVIFANKDEITGELYLPIKLIHTDIEDVAQSIIKSTNKQTPVEDNDLLALTQFQRDLEDYFSGFNDDLKLYYERRAKQYAHSNGLEKGRITTIGSQLKSFASMFLDSPHQAGRYQGTLLKAVKDRVFREKHTPESYYTAAFTFYRFEVCIRRLPSEDRIFRSFKYFLLLAFRYRYENQEFPGAGNQKVRQYCDHLNQQLATNDLAKIAFDECVDILNEAIKITGLPLERDSAKSRPLVDSVKNCAKKRNLLTQSANMSKV